LDSIITFRTLCEGGANVKHTNVHGDTPLHDAVRRNNDVIVRRLLQYGADPNMKNDKGFDCFKLAADLGANGSAVLQSLSLNTYGFELFVLYLGVAYLFNRFIVSQDFSVRYNSFLST